MSRLRLELPEESEANGRRDRGDTDAGPTGHVDSPEFTPPKPDPAEETPDIIRWFSVWASGNAEEA